MAREVKAGRWLFRISDNQRDLQKASVGSRCYSHSWTAPNGERILELYAMGEEVYINTDRRSYVRQKSGCMIVL
jgi:hypothetical protein